MGLTVLMLWTSEGMPCTLEVPDDRFVQHEAPRGGVWLVSGSFSPVDRVEIFDSQGSPHEVAVVPPTLEGSITLRVPDWAEVGTSFEPPMGASYLEGAAVPGQVLTVAAGDVVSSEEIVPPPTAGIEVRETLVGYESLATIPTAPCGFDTGVWRNHYADRPWLEGSVPDGFVMDATIQEAGLAPFVDLPNANAVLFVARGPGDFSEHVTGPPNVEGSFEVHTRLRRVSDGTLGPIVSFQATESDVVEYRTELVGCSGVAQGVGPFAVLLLLALAVRRRSSLSAFEK